MMARIIPLLLAALLLTAPGVQAREVEDVEFPETVTVEGRTLALNGVGMRKKLFIKVYLGALYLEKKTDDPAKVITDDSAKKLVMHFLYKEVGPDNLVEAWQEGFEKNAPDKVGPLRDTIARFNGLFTEPLMKGERMEFTYIPGRGTEVVIKGRSRAVIEGRDFMEALFSIWFGPEPPGKDLKEDMLGH